VPAFEVEDFDNEVERIREFAEIEEINAAGHEWTIVKDSEGNQIDIQSLIWLFSAI